MLQFDSVIHLGILKTILDGVPEPVLVVDRRMHIVLVNNAATDLCGANLVGQLVVAAFRHPNAIDCLSEAAQERQPRETRVTLSESGNDTQFRFLVSPVQVDDVEDFRLVITLRDVSQTDDAEQMRRSFIANVSHELRSPLSALMTCAETLRNVRPDDRDTQHTFLDILSQETQRMNRLVSDLLSLSKVEANERIRPTTPVRIDELLASVIRTMQKLAEAQQSDLQLIIDDSNDFQVNGDADQLRQVFVNLIENSLKYGRVGGRVELSCQHVTDPEEENHAYVVVNVSDEGTGIDSIHLPRLTERFYRVDDHRSRAVGGTGLGLAIVKHVVQRHRGHLSIQSQLGQGSVFQVKLPMLRN